MPFEAPRLPTTTQLVNDVTPLPHLVRTYDMRRSIRFRSQDVSKARCAITQAGIAGIENDPGGSIARPALHATSRLHTIAHWNVLAAFVAAAWGP